MGNFIATGEDDFILTWFGNGLCAQRFDTYGEAIWEKEVVIEDGLTLNGHVEPQMVSDGEGGFVVCYARTISIQEHYVCIQRVSADGETMMGMQSVVTGDGGAIDLVDILELMCRIKRLFASGINKGEMIRNYL